MVSDVHILTCCVFLNHFYALQKENYDEAWKLIFLLT